MLFHFKGSYDENVGITALGSQEGNSSIVFLGCVKCSCVGLLFHLFMSLGCWHLAVVTGSVMTDCVMCLCFVFRWLWLVFVFSRF